MKVQALTTWHDAGNLDRVPGPWLLPDLGPAIASIWAWNLQMGDLSLSLLLCLLTYTLIDYTMMTEPPISP